MDQQRTCPRCGRPLPPDARPGTCPACLLRAGLEPGSSGAAPLDHSNGDEVALGFESTTPGRVLESLARSIGSIPRVLLPDTRDDDRGVAVIKPSSPEMPPPSERGGRYQLFGEIARGGMGAVLKGRDVDLGRDLAVKVLLEGHRDKPDLLRRFVEEAQIGGQLQHPGIVPVYELGTFADSRPYFTMKLVKGRTLASLLQDRAAPGADLPRFLGIFEAVCQTVAYAHARGVIHRDLKPSNVMVGSFGEVQVMDWGLAKVLREGGVADEPRGPAPAASVIQTVRSGSDVDASQAGSVLGTPGYMAPEQARGEIEEIDERADVFGLGAILCEILTGEPAFVGRSPGETMRQAVRGDLAGAFARLEGCAAEPELIAMSRDCLAPERDDRPRDAQRVAERITAYLAGVQERLRAAESARAVAAARAEEARRTAEEAESRARTERRARRLTAALAAALLALAGLGGAGGWWLARQRADRLAATTRAVDDALGKAADLRGRALAAPVGELGGWIAALAEAHRAGDAVQQGVADAALRRRVSAAIAELERARAEARRLADDAEAERRLVARLAEIRLDFINRNSSKDLGVEYAAAFREFGLDLDALDPREAAAAIAGRPATAEIVAALDAWAASLVRWSDLKDPSASRLIEVARAADPDPWRANLRGWIARPPAERTESLKRLAADRDALGRQSASGLLLLAALLRIGGEHDLSTAVSHAAWRRSPGDFWVNWTIGMSSWAMGRGLTRPDEALRYLTAAAALRPDNARVHLNIGNALRAQGKPVEAIAEYREVIRLQPDSATPHCSLGLVLSEIPGKADEAIAACREAVRLKPDDAQTHAALGDVLADEGRPDEAVAEYREAIRLAPGAAEGHIGIGNVLAGRGRLDEAIAEYREAIRLKPANDVAHFNLGIALGRKGKPDEAAAEFLEVIRLAPDFVDAHFNLGYARQLQGRRGEALAALRRAAEVARPGSPLAKEIPGRIRQLERQELLAVRLPAVLEGKDRPASPAEGLDFAQLCYAAKRYAAAARLWDQAFAAAPALAEDLEAGDRYNAACAAALAGAGKGEPGPPPDEPERARWRKQAVAWLEADLAGRRKQVESGQAEARAEAAGRLRHWKADDDLAGIRDPEALAPLPAEEQRACRQLWSEVDALLEKARGRTP